MAKKKTSQIKITLKRKYFTTVLSSIFTILLMCFALSFFHKDYSQKVVKIGFVYIGDSSTAYTSNFCRSQRELEDSFPDNVITIAKYNIPENNCERAIRDLIEEKCDMIFGTNYG